LIKYNDAENPMKYICDSSRAQRFMLLGIQKAANHKRDLDNR
jgi:hypothetical protein